MINYEKLQKALQQLQLQYINYKTLSPCQPTLIKEGISESVIQRFEVCYDCMWKVLKRYLMEDLGIPEVPNSPKGLIRLAHENALFVSTVEQWLTYADARIGTSHDYNGEKTIACLKLMECFIQDAIALYQTMSKTTWA